MDSLQRVAQELKQAGKVTILSHILPDGDCTGSMLALGKALKSLGKEVILVNQDRIPDYLSFLPGAEDVITPEQVTDWASLLVCVDCSDLARLGEEAWSRVKAGKIVNIDHHVSNSGFGFINYVDAGAAATGQIIAKLLGHLDIPLDRELSTLLYTAIVTDTGSFQYSNTSGEVHTLAATLLATGIDVAEINVKLYDNKSISAVKLIGEALHSLEFTGDGKIAWITLPRKVLETIGATDEHTEGLINYARAINTVEVGILFRELASGKIKVGFRSKQWVDVNKLAARFGGGGHHRASGCVIDGKLADVISTVVAKAQEFIDEPIERHN